MRVEVSNGELLDKLSILEIKSEKGLPVEYELEMLRDKASSLLAKGAIVHLLRVLTGINEQLWTIEDTKRKFEQDKNFEGEFVEYARLVYMLNDERAKIKKYIDALSGSVISEVKGHRSY